jgi:3,4-dihydroxy 2-butanone 4-phosphate synthase/GTP cyclohydrolase II
MSGNPHNETSIRNLDTIEDAIEDIRNGKVIIVVDDEDRENEGDFICAADKITPEIVNFMATHGRGLICTPITEKRARELNLRPMVENNNSHHETAFTVSIEAKEGISTGISAYDRAKTIEVAIDSALGKESLVSPGHIFPLQAEEGGVLVRAGHT